MIDLSSVVMSQLNRPYIWAALDCASYLSCMSFVELRKLYELLLVACWLILQ